MGTKGFSSDMLRNLYDAAVAQGWRPERQAKSGHAHVYCPTPGCHFRESFSLSGRGRPHEVAAKVNAMRKHGLIWKGRGGEHTAERLGPGERVT